MDSEFLLKALSDYYLVLLIWLLGPLIGYGVAKDHGLSRAGGAFAGFILGPILVIVLYALPQTLRKCPACDEWMSVKATVCPHCQRDLPQKPAPTAVTTSSARRKVGLWMAALTLGSGLAAAQATPTSTPTPSPTATARPRQGGLAGLARTVKLQRTPGAGVVVNDQTSGINQATPRAGKTADDAIFIESGTDRIIADECGRKWPTDLEMSFFCCNQQAAAITRLEQRYPSDLPNETFLMIRSECKRKWPRDYDMRDFCEANQVQAWRDLHPQD